MTVTEKPVSEQTPTERVKDPIKDWDQVAAQLIRKELAPKGFSEIKSGPWRGTVKSNIEFLPKEVVVRCQNISAQLVRVFRDNTKKQLKDRLKLVEEKMEKASKLRDACAFYEINPKKQFQKEYEHYRDQAGLLEILINDMDNVEVK